MSELQDERRALAARAVGRNRGGSKDASISLTSFNGLGPTLSALGNQAQELLGLSAQPAPMSLTPSLPRTLSQSSGTGQQLYSTHLPSDFSFPQDLDLADPPGAQQDWRGYQVTGNNVDDDADPLQRLASAEPEHLPWNGIHLNGVPPSQPQKEQVRNSSSDPNNVRLGQHRSGAGSHANGTDEGYYTHSQPDIRSMYSGDSNQMHHIRPGHPSIPRTIPSGQGQSGFTNYNMDSMDSTFRAVDYQPVDSMEQQQPSLAQHAPLRCEETGCEFTCKTMSDLKKHTARHKKAHVCNQPRCERRGKGFATINDLERHQKAVHRMEPSHGPSRMYKCFSINCKQREKEWPRLDNFKQHLVRMHRNESVDELTRLSNAWYDSKKKPRQPTSISGRSTPSPDSHLLMASPNQLAEGSSLHQQSQNHLSLSWQPTTSTARLQQLTTPRRPRHASFSSQPNPSPRASPFSSVPPFEHFQSHDTGFGSGQQMSQASGSVNPTQLSSRFSVDSSHPLPHGRMTSALTVPNPDTSALSDLPDMSFASCPGMLTTDQNDLIQIASNFSSEQQPNLANSDPDWPSPSTPSNETRRSSQSFTFSISNLRALIERSGGKRKNESAAWIRIMEAGIQKLSESQHQSGTDTTKSPSPSVVTSALSPVPASTDTCVTYGCPMDRCTKAYPRRCDLKKHLKRHRRPYGCTFSRCHERFGSKYDWKRHENSQHFQPECWKCGLCLNNQNRRGPTHSSHLFYKRDLYKDHLRKVHAASADTVEDHLDKQRIGRGCQTQFWCGFCEKIIVLEKRAREGADERFNHIDEHFKNQDVSTWVNMDGSGPKGQQQDLSDREGDMEDVLGNDGIDEDGGGNEDVHGGDRCDVGSGRARIGSQSGTGQKRALPSDFNPLSSSESRPTRRQRTEPARDNSLGEVFVVCHQCGNGPWLLKHAEKCIMCHHQFCSSCTRSIEANEDDEVECPR